MSATDRAIPELIGLCQLQRTMDRSGKQTGGQVFSGSPEEWGKKLDQSIKGLCQAFGINEEMVRRAAAKAV